MRHIKLLPLLHKTAFLVVTTLVLSACEAPPVDNVQRGYRGTGMVQNYNPRTMVKLAAINQAPASLPAVDASGPKASEIYQNVQVLGDLSVGQFTRLMASMTQWVSPEQGCGYCHNLQNLASDEVYTKGVARAMLIMTIDTNQNWQAHVGDTGVTCYTCHRGKAVPEYVWAESPAPPHAKGIAHTMQNIAAPSAGLSSLPLDPFTPFLEGESDIRVVSTSGLPDGSRKSIKQTEWTYSLMMHFSDSLGVNCTYCHNSQSFSSWQSPPQRAVAWHAIRNVRELNDVIDSVAGIMPANRKGPLGDPYKANCMTCHQGVYRPLFGAKMAKNYPGLEGPGSK